MLTPSPSDRPDRRLTTPLAAFVAAALLACPAGAGVGGWTGGGPEGGQVVDLLQDPDEPEVLHVLTASNGIFRSPDSGATWERANAGLPDELSDFAVAGGGVLYAVHRSSALVWRSLDDGASWQTTASAMPGDLLAWGVAADGTAPGSVWVAAQEGEGTRLFRSDDFGDHWAPAGSHRATARDLAATPLLPGTLFLSPLNGSYVERSDDGGLTWTPMYFARHWRELAIDAQDPRRLVSLRDSGPSVYESLDGGATWQLWQSSRSLSTPR